MRRARKHKPLWLRVLLGEAERQACKAWSKKSPEQRRLFLRDFARTSTENRRRWARMNVKIGGGEALNVTPSVYFANRAKTEATA